MTRLTAYISRTLLASIFLVLVALVGLELFVLYVNELSDIGRGHYGTLQAFYFVLMSLPLHVYLLFPCICLIGVMLGLGELAEKSEITVMQSSGMTTLHITRIVIGLGGLLILCMSVMGETVVPFMTHAAENYKAYASSKGQAMRTRDGIWLRSGDAFVRIKQVIDSHHVRDINQFRFNEKFELIESLSAMDAIFVAPNWQLQHVTVTKISRDRVTSTKKPTLNWTLSMNPTLLKAAVLTPPEMPLWVLHRFIHEQQRNHVEVGYYKLDFWERLFHPMTCVVMLLLAIPFVFGTMRTAMGSRLLIGILCGFGYYMLNRFLGPMCIVYQWPPILAAIGPSLAFLLLALCLFRRIA